MLFKWQTFYIQKMLKNQFQNDWSDPDDKLSLWITDKNQCRRVAAFERNRDCLTYLSLYGLKLTESMVTFDTVVKCIQTLRRIIAREKGDVDYDTIWVT